jgi:hypothetical protein
VDLAAVTRQRTCYNVATSTETAAVGDELGNVIMLGINYELEKLHAIVSSLNLVFVSMNF